MRSNLKSGTFYGKIQKFGERAYKPWEVHELYQEFIQDTKSKLTEEDFILRLSLQKVKTVCIQDVIDKSNGVYIADHIWTDYDKNVWADTLGANFAISLVGHVFEFDADVSHYTKLKDGQVSYDYTLNISKVSDRAVGKAYANAVKVHTDQVNILDRWLEKNL